jgi:hypothetical protein
VDESEIDSANQKAPSGALFGFKRPTEVLNGRPSESVGLSRAQTLAA